MDIETVWTIYANGIIDMQSSVKVGENLPVIPRFGLRFFTKGENVKYEDVLNDVNERDYNDSHRKIAPLKPSEESVIADTSKLSLDESIALIVKIIKEHM